MRDLKGGGGDGKGKGGLIGREGRWDGWGMWR